MTFGGAFVPTFSSVFDRGGAATRPWWDPGGTFTAVAAYQAKGAASLSASYTNLVTPGTYDAAPGVEPTWAVGTGWTFNGSTQYLTTGVVPASGYSMIARFSNVGAFHNRTIIGSSGDSSTRFWLEILTNNARYYGYGSLFVQVGSQTTSGVMAITSAGGYFNGVSETVGGSWSGTGRKIYIGVRNVATALDTFFNGNIQAVAIYSTTLSATQVATLTTQMNAL